MVENSGVEGATIVACLMLGVAIGVGLAWLMLRRQNDSNSKALTLAIETQLEKEKAVNAERFNAKEQECVNYRERIAILTNMNEALANKNEEWQIKHGEEVDRRATAEEKNTRLPEYETVLAQRNELLESQSNTLALQKSQIAELSTQLENERKNTDEKIALLMESKNQLKAEFNHLANKIFEEKGNRFAIQNKQNLDALLMPFKEQITDFKKRVETVYDNESKDRAVLQKEISLLKDLNMRISEDAINLTRALKGENKVQGNWGEMILERVLEESGLQKGREYQTQGSFANKEGKRLRPDVIVHLPEGKDVVIDSKVSLNAYEAYSSAESEDLAAKFIKEHINSIRNHVVGLSGKDYSGLEGLRSLDFVLMFVPVEAAFLKAMEADPSLFSQAFEKNIMIVCPSTLLVTLRTIQNAWRNEYQNQNALEIAKKAGALYDQFVLFTDSILDIGDKLNKAQDSYTITLKRLSTGRGNLVRRTQELQKLGAMTKKKIAESIALPEEDAFLCQDNDQIETTK